MMPSNNTSGVLLLTPFYEPNIGGVETHLSDLTDYIKKTNFCRAYVLTFQPITTKAKGKYFEKDANISIIRIPWIGQNLFHKLEKYPVLEFLYITPWLFTWTFVFLLLRGRKIETIHAQGFNAAFIARLLRKLFNKKFIASTHAIYGLDPASRISRLAKWTLQPADRILTLSTPSKDELVSIGLPANNIEVYRYWVDQNIFKPLDKKTAKKKIGWSNKFVVLFVGRLIGIKGIDVLMQTAQSISKKNLFFAFIGDGPLTNDIKKASEKVDNILFIGRVKNQDLPVYYSAADIFCIPSKYEEGFGRVIIEAISCGTPVIGSKRGGIPEVIDSSVGVLVEPNPEQFKKAIEELYNDKARLNLLTSNCRGHATRRFSKENAKLIVGNY